ncbi:MAG: A24 family peptidase [Firmicutes bacterium]|nr:A24 family peptidase [Bacillota bacterium]
MENLTLTILELPLVIYINFLLAGALAAVCTWTDIKSMTIYNHYTYPAVVTGLIYSVLTAQYDNLYGALIVFAVYLFFFLSGKMGGGDLKLAVALTLFLGMQAVITGSIIAGLVMMTWGFAFTWRKTGQFRTAVLVAAGKLPGGEVPYGAILGPSSLIMAVLLCA